MQSQWNCVILIKRTESYAVLNLKDIQPVKVTTNSTTRCQVSFLSTTLCEDKGKSRDVGRSRPFFFLLVG